MRPISYPWDISRSRGLNELSTEELRAHVPALKERQVELERQIADTRGYPPGKVRQLEREGREELRQLVFAVQSAEVLLTRRYGTVMRIK